MNLKKIKDSLISTAKLSEIVSQMDIAYEDISSDGISMWVGYSGVTNVGGVEWKLDLEEGDTEPYLYHDDIQVDLTPAQKNYLYDYIMANHTVKEPYNSSTEYHNPDYEFEHQIPDSSNPLLSYVDMVMVPGGDTMTVDIVDLDVNKIKPEWISQAKKYAKKKAAKEGLVIEYCDGDSEGFTIETYEDESKWDELD